MTNPKILEKIIGAELINWWLWLLLVFVVGVVYYLSFAESFGYYFYYFVAFFLIAVSGYMLNRSMVFLLIMVFLCGGFYGKFYDYVFLDFIKIDGKVFVDGKARVLEVKKSSLVLTDLELYRSEFLGSVKKKKKIKKVQKSTMVNNYLNLPNYPDINRAFIDKNESYMDVSWVKKDGRDYLPNPPKKIILGIRKKNKLVGVNDVVIFRALLKEKEDDDFAKYDKYHQIGAFGFAIGRIDVIKKGNITNVGQYFLALRDLIDQRLNNINTPNARSIAKAILIGKRDSIDPELQDKIRASGLAHLLAISGLHLAIVAGMFFMLSRMILVHFEYLSLNYNIKKISVVIAIAASLFYLNISGQGVSVQRAFLMILFGFIAVLIDEKPDLRRMVLLVLFILVLANPYILFMVAFQLSFIAVMSVIMVGEFWQEKFRENLTSKFSSYFILIISTSFLIQILTAPILIKNFGFVSLISIIANLAAIPLLSFVIMPFAFFLLALMPFGFEGYVFGILTKLIGAFLHIVEVSASFKYSSITLPFVFNELSVFILFFACLGFFLAKHYCRYLCAMLILFVFFLGLFTNFAQQKEDIIWDQKHKFFALYDKDIGLIFSKKLKNKHLQETIMQQYRQDSFKILGLDTFKSKKFSRIDCNKNRCEIDIVDNDNKKTVLIILKRHQGDICKYHYDQIIYLNNKYLAYDCVHNEVNVRFVLFEEMN